MTQPIDHLARAEALDPNHSFAVSAPAGSGKTGLLTQRVLNLLPRCEHPEEIVSITFTRKAAAEMQERIFNAIRTAATTERPSEPHEQLTWDLAQAVIEHDQRQGWQLLTNPNRLRVQTIDGLCRSLTQQNPISSGMGSGAHLLDHPRVVYQQAAENLLRAVETPGPLQHDISELLYHLDNNPDRVVGLLVSLLARRDQWLGALIDSQNARDYLESVLAELVSESLDDVLRLSQILSSDWCLMADYAGNNCLEDKPESPLTQLAGIDALPDNQHEDLPLWNALVDLLLTADGSWRSVRGLNKNVGFPAGNSKEEKAEAKARKEAMGRLLEEMQAVPGLLEALRVVRILPPCHYPQQQWRLLDSLTRVLPYAVAHLKMVFRNLNATDFSEITQGALQALGGDHEPSELALVLDYQIRHILVDEFQDTASPQRQLLERLTAGWEPGDGRTLFIVGDGMQSCYGFRDANVGIFLDARQAGIGSVSLKPLDLQVNFRSQEGVVNWVNQVFKEAFPGADDISRGAVAYSPSVAFKPALDDEAVTTHLFVDAPDRLAEAAKVVSLVQTALQQEPDGSIAILVRSRPHLQQILKALKQANLQPQATDIDPLSSRMPVIDALSLTRAMLNSNDRNAWLALLRSPLIGLDNSDLLQVAGLQHPAQESLLTTLLRQWQQPQLSRDGRAILARTVPLLQMAWENRRRKRLRYWIEGLWTALGGPATLLSAGDQVDINDFFALLDQHDHGGTIEDDAEFELAVKQLYAKPNTAADPRIQVMTIHKSKGLEFDTVIIPGLDKTNPANDKELLLWQERINRHHQKRLLLSPLAAAGEDDDPLYRYLREEQKLKDSLESTRVLYVGCTRAIKRLHLLANISSAKEALKAPSGSSLLSCLWHSVRDHAQCYPCLEPNVESTEVTPVVLPLIRRLSPQWQRPVLVPGSLLASFRGREFDEGENRVESDYFYSRTARHTGTVLHRTLAQIVLDGINRWDADRIARQRPQWQNQLRGLGLFGNALSDACNRIELGVRRTLEDPSGRWLLDHTHTQSAVELALWSNHRRPRQLIIDRTFVADHCRWIIDYKSSEPANQQSLEAFLAQESATYREQLQGYRQLFKADGLPVKTALYFPLLSRLAEVETENVIMTETINGADAL